MSIAEPVIEWCSLIPRPHGSGLGMRLKAHGLTFAPWNCACSYNMLSIEMCWSLLSWPLWSGRRSSWLAWGTHSPVYNHQCHTWGLRPPHATNCGQLGEGQGSILVCIIFLSESYDPVIVAGCSYYVFIFSSRSIPPLHPSISFHSLTQLTNMKSWCWRRISVASRRGLSRLTRTVPAIGSRTRDQLWKCTSKQLRAFKQLYLGEHLRIMSVTWVLLFYTGTLVSLRATEIPLE